MKAERKAIILPSLASRVEFISAFPSHPRLTRLGLRWACEMVNTSRPIALKDWLNKHRSLHADAPIIWQFSVLSRRRVIYYCTGLEHGVNLIFLFFPSRSSILDSRWKCIKNWLPPCICHSVRKQEWKDDTVEKGNELLPSPSFSPLLINIASEQFL